MGEATVRGLCAGLLCMVFPSLGPALGPSLGPALSPALGLAHGQTQQPKAPSGFVLIKAGRLLDVRTGKTAEKQALLIEGERIREVGPEAAVATHAPQGTRVIDLGSSTVMPGLIDAHTHLTYEAYVATHAWLGVSIPREALMGAKNARLTLRAGFTTVRNLGARGYSDVALRDAINAGDVQGPRMLVSGPALGATGGHMDCSILPSSFHYSEEGVADGREGVMRKTREVIKYGADIVKVAVTGGVFSAGTDPSQTQYSDEELRAIVEEAHRLGRKVAAHAHGAAGLKQAVRAGVDSIEHGTLIDDEGIALMKARGTWLVPTLYTSIWVMEHAKPPEVPQAMLDKGYKLLPVAKQNIRRAFQAGVKIAFGTDSSVYPHGLNANEFRHLVEIGMTPLQAIQAATVQAAELLGWGDRIGTLQPGAFADLIALPADPLRDVRVLESVPFVMKGGEVMKDERAP